MHSNNDKLDKMLTSIQQVPSPDYLFTRIQTAIAQEQSLPLSWQRTLAFGIGLVLILSSNIWALQFVIDSPPVLDDVANSMLLIDHVILY